MSMWQRFGKVKGTGALVLAAVVAIATVSPGGAFSSGGTTEAGATDAGHSFEAFVAAWTDEVVSSATEESSEPAATVEAETPAADVTAEGGTEDVATETQTDPETVVEDVGFGSATTPNFTENAAQAAAVQEQALEQASTQDVINALLALLNTTEPQVMAAIDAAEAAVLAKIDQARADTVAAFAQTDMGETEAEVLAHIDAARILVQQAFDMIRAKVAQGFADARTTIIEELTGVEFGDALDEVLAEIAEIQNFVTNALADVQDLLPQVGVGG
jgi:hypothetical protein